MADVEGKGAAALVFEEEGDAELGEGEVGDDHAGQDGEKGEWQGLEAEQMGDWFDVGNGDAEGGAAEGGDEERFGWTRSS